MTIEELTLCERGECKRFNNLKTDSLRGQMTDVEIDTLKKNLCKMIFGRVKENPDFLSDDCPIDTAYSKFFVDLAEDIGEFDATT